MKIKTTSYALAVMFSLTTAATLLPTGCAATSTQESTGQYIDDAGITSKVKAKLIGDSTVKARQVDVDTYQGVVQLSGFVDTQEQKDRAAQVAATVPGVKSVKNNLVVKPVS